MNMATTENFVLDNFTAVDFLAGRRQNDFAQ
jgi:hypothetical protein